MHIMSIVTYYAHTYTCVYGNGFKGACRVA